jgi:hypothetical protein
VFLNPMGIVNAASFPPFEAQIAPGEFLLLTGSSLATQTEQRALYLCRLHSAAFG